MVPGQETGGCGGSAEGDDGAEAGEGTGEGEERVV